MSHFVSSVNMHDRVIALIAACIDSGTTTVPHIIGTLKRLGFNNRHVALLLNQNAGFNAGAHWWALDEKGIYSLLPS